MTDYEQQQQDAIARRRQTETDRDAREERFYETTIPALISELNRIDTGHAEAPWMIERRAPENGRHSPAISNANGERFWIFYDRYKHKIEIHGTYGERLDGRVWIPRDAYPKPDVDDPRPTMSADKAPAQLARDIQRRFLVDYRTLRAVYLANMADARAHQANVQVLADELFALGVLQRSNRQDPGATERIGTLHDVGGVRYGDCQIGADYVSFRSLSITPELAREFFALIARRNKKGGK